MSDDKSKIEKLVPNRELNNDEYLTFIDASINPFDNTVYAEFRHEDKRWYMKINDEMIALEDIIESLKTVNEKLLEIILKSTHALFELKEVLGDG